MLRTFNIQSLSKTHLADVRKHFTENFDAEAAAISKRVKIDSKEPTVIGWVSDGVGVGDNSCYDCQLLKFTITSEEVVDKSLKEIVGDMINEILYYTEHRKWKP